MKFDAEKNINRLKMLIIVGIITLVGQKIGYGISPIQAIPGMVLCIVIAMGAFALKEIIPLKIPAFAFASLIALILTMPYLPTASFILKYIDQVGFLATTTPILAYAGVSIGLSVAKITKMSWKLVIIACVVFLGTFFGSAIIAQIVLEWQGII